MARAPSLMEPLEVENPNLRDVQEASPQRSANGTRGLSTVFAVVLIVTMVMCVAMPRPTSSTSGTTLAPTALALRHSALKASQNPMVQFQAPLPVASRWNPKTWKPERQPQPVLQSPVKPTLRQRWVMPPCMSVAEASTGGRDASSKSLTVTLNRKPVIMAGRMFSQVPLSEEAQVALHSAEPSFGKDYFEYLQGPGHTWQDHWQNLLTKEKADQSDQRKFWENMMDTVVTDIRDFPEGVGHLRRPYLHEPVADKPMHDDEAFWHWDKFLKENAAPTAKVPFTLHSGTLFEEVHASDDAAAQAPKGSSRLAQQMIDSKIAKASSEQGTSAVDISAEGKQIPAITTGTIFSHVPLFPATPVGATSSKAGAWPCTRANDQSDPVSVIVGTSALVDERPGLVQDIVSLVNSAYLTSAIDSGSLLRLQLEGRDLERVTEKEIEERLDMGNFEITGKSEGGAFDDAWGHDERANRVLHLAFKGDELVGVISSTIQPPWTEKGVGHWGFLYVRPEATSTENYVFVASRHNKEKDIVSALINSAEERLASAEGCNKIQVEYEHVDASSESTELMRSWYSKRLGFECSEGFTGGYRKASGATLTKCQKPIAAEVKASVEQRPFAQALTWQQENDHFFKQAMATVTLQRNNKEAEGGTRLLWARTGSASLTKNAPKDGTESSADDLKMKAALQDTTEAVALMGAILLTVGVM